MTVHWKHRNVVGYVSNFGRLSNKDLKGGQNRQLDFADHLETVQGPPWASFHHRFWCCFVASLLLGWQVVWGGGKENQSGSSHACMHTVHTIHTLFALSILQTLHPLYPLHTLCTVRTVHNYITYSIFKKHTIHTVHPLLISCTTCSQYIQYIHCIHYIHFIHYIYGIHYVTTYVHIRALHIDRHTYLHTRALHYITLPYTRLQNHT